MAIKKVQIKNITVFDKMELEFSPGINVFVGDNGVGKTHLMKILYSACQASDPKVSFSQKMVRCFCPDDYKIARLIHRKQGMVDACVRVTSQDGADSKAISAAFNNKTKKWDANISGIDGWEKHAEMLKSVFIPAKEILSNSFNLNAAVEKNNIIVDDTYLDIINAAKIDISVGKDAAKKRDILKRIEEIINGKVTFDVKRDEFYLRRKGTKFEFNLVAEGLRKFALLWQLIKNGALMNGAILFWDEPEANINPIHIPVIVEILLELQRNGVQIFVSTHDYILAKYFDIYRTDSDSVDFSFFYFEDEEVRCKQGKTFDSVENNPIMKAFDGLLDTVYGKLLAEI